MVDLSKLLQRRARLEASLAAATTTLRDAQRRDDTRRKVVAGASLLNAIRDGAISADVLATLVAKMQPRDAALFADVAPVTQRDWE
ncbi:MULTISPECIES: hypothetical protein [unclassified Aureimonas]|uniref:hypothetical protein n=1 Tax=unclassified Aureimonas TaxID=2615206 RepID=UPI0006FA5D0C|nr:MULTISPECIES: hypothetical protein [unclassified Aureimonas]KQT64157.1 hypothetical protein ASG62_03940 [Aureimonas sp. Leaf427]KQT81346.1 hypothetical protein ASG54_01210 [Aureimonas sp. Leaf460]